MNLAFLTRTVKILYIKQAERIGKCQWLPTTETVNVTESKTQHDTELFQSDLHSLYNSFTTSALLILKNALVSGSLANRQRNHSTIT